MLTHGPRSDIAIWTVGVIGVYVLGVSLCLWRRWNGMRMWVVFTTMLALFALLMAVRRGIWNENPLLIVSSVLRVAVAGLLFLPPVRRWFAPQRA